MDFLDFVIGQVFEVKIWKGGISVSQNGYYLEQVASSTTWHPKVFKYKTYAEAVIALGLYLDKVQKIYRSKPKPFINTYQAPVDEPLVRKKRGRSKNN